MSLVKVFNPNIRVGSYIKELSLLGYTSSMDKTKFVLEIMNTIDKYKDSEESGFSIWQNLDIAKRLMYHLPLTEIEHPELTGEFICHTDTVKQSTRLHSLFSNNGGKNWYDINNQTFINKIFKFVAKLIPGEKPEWINRLIFNYVKFPYKPSITPEIH